MSRRKPVVLKFVVGEDGKFRRATAKDQIAYEEEEGFRPKPPPKNPPKGVAQWIMDQPPIEDWVRSNAKRWYGKFPGTKHPMKLLREANPK